MEDREDMKGGGVASGNGAMKTPTHLPTHTLRRHKGKRLRGK